MTPITNVTAALNAEASVLMEGFFVTDEHKELCQKYLAGQVSLSECLMIINSKYIKEQKDAVQY